MKTSDNFIKKAMYVVEHGKEFPGRMLESEFNVRRPTIMQLRRDEKKLTDIKFKNVLNLVKAYEHNI